MFYIKSDIGEALSGGQEFEISFLPLVWILGFGFRFGLWVWFVLGCPGQSLFWALLGSAGSGISILGLGSGFGVA